MKPKYLRFALTAALAGAVAFSASLPASALGTPSLSRGEVFKLITDKLKLSPNDTKGALPSDVAADSPYANAVRVLKERKILEGYPDGTFKPDQPITAREFGFVLGRFLGIEDGKSADTLTADYGIQLTGEGGLSGDRASAAVEAALKNDDKARQLLLDSNTKQLELKSFHALIKTKTSITAKAGEDFPMTDIEATVDQDIHMEKGIHQIVNTGLGKENMKIEQYIVPEGMFMKVKDPVTGEEKWSNLGKAIPLNFDELIKMQKQSTSMAAKLTGETLFYRDLGKNAKGLHGIKVQGRLSGAELLKLSSDLFGQGSSPMQTPPPSELSGMTVSTNGVIWINEETKLPGKMQYDMTIQYGDSKDVPFNSMSISIDADISDYNQITDIVLPAEAKNAPDMSGTTPLQPPAK